MHREGKGCFMARKDEKTRTAFWIENDLLRRCDECWKKNGFASRNEFVGRAIEQYIATLTLEQLDDLLVERLGAAIARAADDSAVKISKGLFRYAVGQEMILHILAHEFGIESDQVSRLRGLAIRNVRKTRGKVSLEAIADFQNERPAQSRPGGGDSGIPVLEFDLPEDDGDTDAFY